MPSVASNPAVDWDFAFMLFSQGLPYPEISLKTGAKEPAIRMRASRCKWKDRVTQARKAASQDMQRRVESLTSRAEKWVNREATNVELVSEVLDSVPIPKSIVKLSDYVALRAQHGKHGRSTFGLDNQAHSVNVSIGMVSLGDVMPADEPIVDVQTVADTGIEPVSNTPASP